MKFVTGSTEKQVMEISDVLAQLDSLAGKEIRMNGAIHTIRDMGDVAFVVLRKREGLVQTVFETGAVKEKELKDLKEAATVEVSGVVALEDRAPNGFEIRLTEVTILSEPKEPMPIPISKWKLNTSLETKLNLRPISLRNVRERAKFKIQEGIVRGFRDYLFSAGIYRNSYPEDWCQRCRGRSQYFQIGIFPQTCRT